MLGGVGVVARRVVVPALVRRYHHPAVLRQPLHPLLHPAVAVRAAVVASTRSPRVDQERTSFNSQDGANKHRHTSCRDAQNCERNGY